MRLRQVALMAHKIAPVAGQLEYVFGLKVAFRDPGVGVFGLANVVMPAGGEFIEVLEPIRDDASGARYLARRGGERDLGRGQGRRSGQDQTGRKQPCHSSRSHAVSHCGTAPVYHSPERRIIVESIRYRRDSGPHRDSG